MLLGHRTLRDGDLGRISRLHRRCLAVTALRGGVSSAAFLLLVLWIWLPLFGHLPARASAAAGLLAVLLPGLGLGTLIGQYGVRRSARWVALGLATAALWAAVVP